MRRREKKKAEGREEGVRARKMKMRQEEEQGQERKERINQVV